MKNVYSSTAAILCGGKSSRMGFDKSLLKFDGEFALLKTMNKLEEFFSEVIFITNERTKFPKEFSSVKLVEDFYKEKGPLGGLVTALEISKTDNIFLIACDIPKINDDLILEMAKYINKYQIVICEQKGQLEPLFAFYNKSCLPIFKEQLNINDLKLRRNFDKFSLKKITLDSESTLDNVNKPNQLNLWN